LQQLAVEPIPAEHMQNITAVQENAMAFSSCRLVWKG
jgi:hypothetical protein